MFVQGQSPINPRYMISRIKLLFVSLTILHGLHEIQSTVPRQEAETNF